MRECVRACHGVLCLQVLQGGCVKEDVSVYDCVSVCVCVCVCRWQPEGGGSFGISEDQMSLTGAGRLFPLGTVTIISSIVDSQA